MTGSDWCNEWSLVHPRTDTKSKTSFSDILSKHKSFFASIDANEDNVRTAVRSAVEAFIAADCSAVDAQKRMVLIGLSLLGAFVQVAWTGPQLDFELSLFLSPEMSHKLKVFAPSILSIDGEDAYHLAPHPVVLVLAKLILVDASDLLLLSETLPWWKLRTLFIHQRVLDNPSNSLSDQMSVCMSLVWDKVAALELRNELDAEVIGELKARLHLEVGLIHHFYTRNTKALAEFTKAQECTQLKWELTGALGKRTKFQTFDVSQLVVIAESKNFNKSPTTETRSLVQSIPSSDIEINVPEALALNDDTLLEAVDYTDLKKGRSLKIVDQCILLAMCLNVKNSNPADGLTTEQMKPFVARVLENPNNWMVHTMGLLLRSRLEAHKSRTAERSVLQLQALVDQMAGVHDATASERLSHIYSILIPSKWELESELGDRLVSIGVVKSALEIFERLELWDNVVSCYQMLEKPKQAEDIVRKQLETNPNSPKLHCLLGDITREPHHYNHAWELSNKKYSRAMRSLGALYFRNGDFEMCVSSYALALELNPLFENSWFVMGCAALRIESWTVAQRAFQQTVSLNPDNGEAWTNLASVYVKLSRKRDAWRALREALRQHHENAKIWDNYLFTSMDLREFSEAVRAMTRIVEIRGNPAASGSREGATVGEGMLVDIGCLELLVDAVVHNLDGAEGTLSAGECMVQVEGLLQMLVGKVSGSYELYTLCAQFYTAQERYKDALEYLGKAYRVVLNAPDLSHDARVFRSSCEVVERLSEGYKEFGPLEETPRVACEADGTSETNKVVVCKDWRYQGRMALRTFIGRTKDSFEGTPEHNRLKELLASFSAGSS